MRFRRDASLDTGQVQDRRGAGGGAVGGLGGLGVSAGWAERPSAVAPVPSSSCWWSWPSPCSAVEPGRTRCRSDRTPRARSASATARSLAESCQTGEDANQTRGLPHRRRRELGAGLLDRHGATGYQRGRHACSSPARCRPGAAGATLGGRARSTAPRTRQVYIDLGFYDELARRFGAQRWSVRRGLRDRARVRPSRAEPARRRRAASDGRPAPTSGSVRLELQADCYAGVWAAHAVDGGLIEELTPADIADGLDAGGGHRRRPHPGDRRTGQVDPESWTHGSSRAAPALVHDRLPVRRPERLRHVRRRQPLANAPGHCRPIETGHPTPPPGAERPFPSHAPTPRRGLRP